MQRLTMLARKFILKRPFEGLPKLGDFEIVEEKLSDNLGNGEILARAEWLTVDPYMRLRSTPGNILPGGQIATVLKSKHTEFPEGCKIYGFFGWRDLTVYKPDDSRPRDYQSIYKLPDMKGLPESYGLGAVGMPGVTGYYGLLEICNPKPGDTLVVTAAGGAVGSVVGQIGKIKGCKKVIGFVGSDDKVKVLENTFGFDVGVNYKKMGERGGLDKVLKEVAPEGVDCYFDNVGGEFVYHITRNMSTGGRIAQCGSISGYNNIVDASKLPSVPFDYPQFRIRQIKMEGFQASQWSGPKWFEALHQLRDWILEGKIKVEETVMEGFENMPKAFINVLEGKNTGKQVIKVNNILGKL